MGTPYPYGRQSQTMLCPQGSTVSPGFQHDLNVDGSPRVPNYSRLSVCRTVRKFTYLSRDATLGKDAVSPIGCVPHWFTESVRCCAVGNPNEINRYATTSKAASRLSHNRIESTQDCRDLSERNHRAEQ